MRLISISTVVAVMALAVPAIVAVPHPSQRRDGEDSEDQVKQLVASITSDFLGSFHNGSVNSTTCSPSNMVFRKE